MKNSRFLNAGQRRQLEGMYNRAGQIELYGLRDGVPHHEYLTTFVKGILDDETPDTLRFELVQRAREGNRDAVVALNALRVETTQNFVMASSHWLPWFEVVNLAKGDQVEWINETRHQVKVRRASQNGGQTQVSLVLPQQRTTIEMLGLTTDKVTYQLEDWQRGEVGSLAQRQFDLAFELRNQLDAELFAYVSSGIAAFTLTGAKEGRTYVPHSSIRTGVLPTTNALAVASVSGSTKFGFTTLDAIIDYCARWVGAFATGDLYPTGEVIVPADVVKDISAGLNLTTAQSAIMEELAKNGFYSVAYMGRTWRFIPSNTVPAGFVWPRLSQPFGTLYLKPEFNESVTETDRHMNRESRWERMVYGCAMPEPKRVNLIRVEFNTTGH